MTIFDQVSLAFVAICAVGIAYLILVQPLREWLSDTPNQKRKPKHGPTGGRAAGISAMSDLSLLADEVDIGR